MKPKPEEVQALIDRSEPLIADPGTWQTAIRYFTLTVLILATAFAWAEYQRAETERERIWNEIDTKVELIRQTLSCSAKEKLLKSAGAHARDKHSAASKPDVKSNRKR